MAYKAHDNINQTNSNTSQISIQNMSRSKTHLTETTTQLIFEEVISSFSNAGLSISEGDLLFCEVSERDYGYRRRVGNL